MFVEGEKVLIKHDEIVEEFSKYFENVINDLDLYEFSSCPMKNSIDEIDSLILKFKSHSSILKIKQNLNITEKFSFKEVPIVDIKKYEKIFLTNKVSGGEIPLHILKNANFNLKELRSCVNSVILNDKLELAETTF